MLCGTNNILWNIFQIQPEWRNISQNIVNPPKHYYAYA